MDWRDATCWWGGGEAFTAYGNPLALVTAFRCLGQVISEDDNDWSVLVCNLWKAWRNRERLTWVLIDQGGGGFPDLGPDILGGGSVGYFVWVRYVGDDAAHREGVG